MLARLWWKEARLFWPIWLALVVAAAGVHWLALKGFAQRDQGALVPLALGWAVLYALAAGAAAFAGERENRTLLFLDILPVGRRTLWWGKASFALVSSFLLALALALLGHLGAEGSEPFAFAPSAASFCLLLFEAVVWGLLWSAALSNALIAGILAVCSLLVGGVLLIPMGFVERITGGLVRTEVQRLLLDAGALTVSGWLMTRRPRPCRRERPRGPLAWPAVRSLAWQTSREARPTWLIMGLVSFAWPLLAMMAMRGDRGEDVMNLAVGLGGLMGLAAGVNVLRTDGQARTHVFYAGHGVRPGKVWAVKVLVWTSSLLVYGLVLWIGSAVLLASVNPQQALWAVAPIFLALAYGFAVALLCGQVIRRQISAALIAVMLLLVLIIPQHGLAIMGIIPMGSLVLAPLILLGISRAWVGDWMFDQRGAGRWVRLALLLVVPFGLLLAAYAGYRAGSAPDIGPPFDPAEFRPATVPADRDPIATYGRATARLKSWTGDAWAASENGPPPEVAEVILTGWDPSARWAIAWWRENQEALALVRQGSALPEVRAPRAQDLVIWEVDRAGGVAPRRPRVLDLAQLVALDARERQARGDLAGAWDDILVLLRLGRQFTFPSATMPTTLAVSIQGQAERVGISWAADPRQTPELLGAALESLRRFPANAPLSRDVKARHHRLERVLDLPDDDLLAMATPRGPDGEAMSPAMRLVFGLVITPPWERERSRRVTRLLTAERLQWVDLEPWQRPPLKTRGRLADLHWPASQPSWHVPAEAIAAFWESTPLVRFEPPILVEPEARDRELTQRRALVQILALRRWQLRHGGRLPDRLEALVPSELAALPSDPYSGAPFGYVRSSGQDLFPAGANVSVFLATPNRESLPTRPGQWILYSIGPDRRDDLAGREYDPSRGGDFTYTLPFDAGPREAGRPG